MQICSSLHGRYKDVARAAKRMALAFERGADVQALVQGCEADLDELPGLIVLDGPSPLLGGGNHFHAFALSRALLDVEGDSPEGARLLRKRWLDDSLLRPWTFLGLLGQVDQDLVPDSRLLDLLDGATAHWQALQDCGKRYSSGLPSGSSLWEAQRMLTFALARQGVDLGSVRPPEKSAELERLTAGSPGRRVRDLLSEGLHEKAVAILRQSSQDIVLLALAEHFVTRGQAHLAAPVIREAAQKYDTHGILVGWLSQHGSDDAHTAVQDARSAFLRRPGFAEWQHLKSVGSPEIVEQALEELSRGERADSVLWVHLWEKDGKRALATWEKLWAQPGSNHTSLGFSAEQVAGAIVASLPERAANLYLIAAKTHVRLRNPSAYKSAAGLVRSASDAFRTAGKAERAKQAIADFRAEHRKLQTLIAVLDAAGL
jgi:hypothetical protein